MQFSWVPPHHRLDRRTRQKDDVYTTFTHCGHRRRLADVLSEFGLE
jgi:hypothetical protein